MFGAVVHKEPPWYSWYHSTTSKINIGLYHLIPVVKKTWITFLLIRCTSCFSANPWFVKICPRSINYQGLYTVTKDNVDCQRWDVQTPHDHTYTDSSFYLEDSVGEASNYCRQLGGEPWPWCYTTSDQRWDFCGKLELYCGKCLTMALRNVGLYLCLIENRKSPWYQVCYDNLQSHQWWQNLHHGDYISACAMPST